MRGRFLSVIQLNQRRLSNADVSAILALSYKLVGQGMAGACVPAEMDDGERMVAILDSKNEDILLGFGCDISGYYVFDFEGKPITESCECIEDVLPLLEQCSAHFWL
jgi:hypothetical protein